MTIEIGQAKSNPREFLTLEKAQNMMNEAVENKTALKRIRNANVPINLTKEASTKIYLLYLIDRHLNNKDYRPLRALMVLRVNGMSIRQVFKYMKTNYKGNITRKNILEGERKAMTVIQAGIAREKDSDKIPLFGDALDHDPNVETMLMNYDVTDIPDGIEDRQEEASGEPRIIVPEM